MTTVINLNNLDRKQSANFVASSVKDAVIKKDPMLIVTDSKDGTSIIREGDLADILTLMVLGFASTIEIYKITDIDGILNCFTENVKSVLKNNGD